MEKILINVTTLLAMKGLKLSDTKQKFNLEQGIVELIQDYQGIRPNQY